MKTAEQIEEMKQKWIESYADLPQFTMFGEDNWAKRDYVANVLEQCKDKPEYQLDRMAEAEEDMSEDCDDEHDVALKAIDWARDKWQDFEDYCEG